MKKKSTKWVELFIGVIILALGFFVIYYINFLLIFGIYLVAFFIFIWEWLTSQIYKKKEEKKQETREDKAEETYPVIDEADSEKLRKRIYRILVKKYHPDLARTHEEKEQFTEKMKIINEAYKANDLSKLKEVATGLGIEKAEILRPPREKIDIGSQKTVLYADKEKGFHLLIAEEFQDAFGAKVNTVSFDSVTDAFDYLISTNVDLVISDIIFHQPIDGITFLKACKILYPELPFVIYTVIHHLKHDFGTFASDAYVVKSGDLSEIIKTVEKFLKDRHSTEEVNSKIRAKDAKTLHDLGLAYKELTPEK